MAKYSTILNAIVARLELHAVAGGLLDGFRIKDAPMKEVLGRDDVRVIGVFLPEINEQWAGSNVEVGLMTVVLGVGTRKEDGVLVHVQAIERMLDALEQTLTEDDELVFDPVYGGLLRQPYDAAVGRQVVLELSLNSEVRLDIAPVTHPVRGRMRS